MLVLTVGWSPKLVNDLLPHGEGSLGHRFVNAVVDEAVSLDRVRSDYPQLEVVALGPSRTAGLPPVNWPLLASLEAPGVPTVKTMIAGDPYLRHVRIETALRYVTFLAGNLSRLAEEYAPTVILGSHDRAHSGIALAVARLKGIPFVALTFTSIPSGLIAFSKALNPNELVPLERPIGEDIRNEAAAIVRQMREAPSRAVSFRPSYVAPRSVVEYGSWWTSGLHSYVHKTLSRSRRGVPPMSGQPAMRSIQHRARRSWNRLTLPRRDLITAPPPRPFAFHTLHLAPESTVDTWAPWYQDQIALVKLLAMSMPVGLEFVVKLHYADPDNYSRSVLRGLERIKGVRIAAPHSPTYDFIARAELVTGITGTACLEAALLGKSVLMFGDSPYLAFPRTEFAERPSDLPRQIARMTSAGPAPETEVAEAYARYLSRYLPGVANDWSRELPEGGRRNVAVAFEALASYLGDPRQIAAWYLSGPFTSTGDASAGAGGDIDSSQASSGSGDQCIAVHN